MRTSAISGVLACIAATILITSGCSTSTPPGTKPDLSLSSGWIADSMSNGFMMRHIDQGRDYSGPVRSTVIRKQSPCGDSLHRAVLYVHGYNDYFFQREMADRFVDSCYSFYAVDLRKYGRSLMPRQKPFQVRDMSEYFPDIDSAIAVMKADGIRDITLMGHSTGGLTTSLYMNRQPDPTVKRLILNSPFLDWNQSRFQEKWLIPIVNRLGALVPDIKISQDGSGSYAHSLLKDYEGEWEYDTTLKKTVSPPVDFGWIRAIDRAQGELQKGGHIRVPILLMHSDSTARSGMPHDAWSRMDAVLDVDDIAGYGRRLGSPSLTEDTIHGGLHDLILSRPDVRENAYSSIFRWLEDL